MICLIDLDSILYKAVYKVVFEKEYSDECKRLGYDASYPKVFIREMRKIIKEYGSEGAREWFMQEIYDLGLNRCEKEMLKINMHLQDAMFEEITGYEVFITTCSKSFRKELAPSYKANRKRNNYVWMLREHYRFNDAKHSETLEADDLISLRAKELGIGNYVIVSMDKDLKQIGGYYWSYYKQKAKDFEGNVIENEFGLPEMEYKQKEVQFITPEEAEFLFWQQVLMGDKGDGIDGLYGIGLAKSKKILKDSKCLWVTVAREYIKRDQKEDFKINYQLLKLK